jgi:glycosyltransferase involved in cell wall biosynthesis
MQSKLVSIIIPTYNAQDFISECIQSVINQTYRNIEIIIINDGSTDSTREIIEKFDDIRIRIINQVNKGASFSKNVGLAHAKGDYIQYLDADDKLSKDKILNQVLILENNRSCIAVCKTKIISNDLSINDSEIDTDIISDQVSGLQFLLNLLGAKGKFAMVQPNAYLVPIEVIKKSGSWYTDLYPCPDEDGEYFSRILLNSKKVYFANGINYYRKITTNISLSKQIDRKRIHNQLKTTVRKFENIFELRSDAVIMRLFQQNITHVVYQYGLEFPEIIQMGKEQLTKYGINKYKFISLSKFSTISRFIGINNTFKLKRYFLNLNRYIVKN